MLKSKRFTDEFIFFDTVRLFDTPILQLRNSCSKELKEIWKFIIPCISGYLIKESYEKVKSNRIERFINYELLELTESNNEDNKKNEILNENDLIELRKLGTGSFFAVSLFYHIEKEELIAIKKANCVDNDIPHLMQREINNYSKINHPLIPKYIGTNKNKDCIVMEFINGCTLKNIKNLNLTYREKIKIIFELVVIFDYLHRNNFVYRDLKPNNIMIDENKTAVLIDFDKMVLYDDYDNQISWDFSILYSAPEINSYKLLFSNDIYSLGKIINYIMFAFKDHTDENLNKYKNLDNIKNIIKKCTEKIPNERFSIPYLFLNFCTNYKSEIDLDIFFELHIENLEKFTEEKKNSMDKNILHQYYYIIGNFYNDGKLKSRNNKKFIYYLTIAANQNVDAQNFLFYLYYKGKIVERDISKSIHYLTLSANQNHSNAQFKLGCIYYEGTLIPRDINKSIHYLTLSANQNNSNAQCKLGCIYYEGTLIPRDMNKSIHYLTLAANQNHPNAQITLGYIYFVGKVIPQDISKSIHYLTLAANQNDPFAQFILGCTNSDGTLTPRNINKSIHYLTLAANQNDSFAQCKLGMIYYEGTLIPRDINKSIHYLTLAANQNDTNAQFLLGCIYYEGTLIPEDINKSIHYLTLAANQNDSFAQCKLGMIYYEGALIPRDINKSIHYFTLSDNLIDSQYYLGLIYLYFVVDKTKGIRYLESAANNDHPDAQYTLALYYIYGFNIEQNINKGFYYMHLTAQSGDIHSQFCVGCFHHFGFYCKQDINKAIFYYKQVSSFNSQYAKNNLGMIYKHGFEKQIDKNLGWAIEFFDEAIRIKNDYLSMYNLAHLHFYEEPFKDSIEKAIQLLIKSAKLNFKPSLKLLCIASVMNFGYDLNKIIKELNKYENISNILRNLISKKIKKMKLENIKMFEYYYNNFHNIDFIYSFPYYMPILYSKIFVKKQITTIENKTGNEINSDFYEGFGIHFN